MKNNKQSIHASTQKFTEIVDIIDNIVLLEGGNAALVIEVTGINFALLSKKEQDSRIFSYAAMLNSLSFPIQILVKNRRIDISSYLKLLEEEEKKTQNQLLAEHIRLYRDFVSQMVTINTVLDKSFYIVISYSSLESGLGGAPKSAKGQTADAQFVDAAKKSLASKAESIHGQIRRIGVNSTTLEKDDLIKLFYEVYNDGSFEAGQVGADTAAPLVKFAGGQG